MSNFWDRERLLRSTILAGFAAAGLAGASAYAQDAVDELDEDEAEQAQDSDDTIVVTGSRIRRDSFTSTSPLQVIDDEAIAESGFVDVGDILRNTTVVTGAQLDLTVNSTNVTNAGPGGQAVSLRGLQPERTLILVNGRRYAPAGVEGAPSFPDISLIPSSMIQRIDVLLDGASSVYGADAVAGVVNVILRDNYEGVQLDAMQTFTQGGGEQTQVSLLAGDHSERSSYIFGFEYTMQEEMLGNSRDWMWTGTRYGPVDVIEDPSAPGSNIPQWVEGTSHAWQAFGAWVGTPGFGGAFAVDPTGQGTYTGRGAGALPGFITWNFTLNPLLQTSLQMNQDEWLTPNNETTTAYFRGTYDISDFLPGTEAFVEMNLSNRQTFFLFPWQTIDASVTASNAYNPFGMFEPDPANPGQYRPRAGGAAINDSFTARPTQPWRNYLDVELTQYRFTTGLTGDLGFVGLNSWDYETFFGYTRSQGNSRRTGTREIPYWQSQFHELDSNGRVQCAEIIDYTQVGDFAGSPTPETCVPWNPLDLGLWRTDGGNPTYSTDGRTAEDITNWLRGFRDYATFVDELTFGGFATGPLFALPAGDVEGVIGFEWRETALESRADDNAERGGLQGFFADAASDGSVESYDIFGELSIPLLAGAPLAEEFTVDVAGRFVNNEYYGENSVYSARARWRPTDWLTLRGTMGTSFRAPSLRELFLEGQTSFAADPDPCRVPALAQVDLDGDNDFDYDVTQDNRSPQTLANCFAEGLDPTSLGLGVFGGSVEQINAGNTGLNPETSDSYTYGFVIEQPWFSSFDLRFGVSWFDITIEDAVSQPTSAQTAQECYRSTNFPNDPFCQRIGPRDTLTNFLTTIDVTPFNLAEETAKGYDMNLFVARDFDVFGNAIRAEVDWVWTNTEELNQVVTIGGVSSTETTAGELGAPEWRSTMNARIIYEDWTMFWQTRYIGEQSADIRDVPVNCNDGAALDVVRCYTAPEEYYHDASVSYTNDMWTFRVGVNNVFDTAPVRIDEDVSTLNSSGFGLNPRSVPQGLGYDMIGRRGFVRVSRRF